MNEVKTLRNAILFADGTRASLLKVREKDYRKLEVLYQENNNTWNIKSGEFDGGLFSSIGDEYNLQFKEEAKLPYYYDIMDMLFAEKANGEIAMSGLTSIYSFSEVVAHFWNHKNVPIRMIGYSAGSVAGKQENSAMMYYPMTTLAIDANEFGFYDENRRFWRVLRTK